MAATACAVTCSHSSVFLITLVQSRCLIQLWNHLLTLLRADARVLPIVLVAVLFSRIGSATGAFRTDYFGIIKHMGVFIGPILILYFFHGLLTKHGHWLLFLFV